MSQQIKCGGCRGMFDSEELRPCLYCDTMLCEECYEKCDCVDAFSDFDEIDGDENYFDDED